ncbi:MAG: hypothetical protein CME62_12635 [Halobacteriovoraceae bacterium]|nr:hypothetical protein [Halobacteriovoraceae bacterium]|tara:strand:+ start:21349 stop:22242 length:894 start_codon:yes stop_codon:yes gene_type:complete
MLIDHLEKLNYFYAIAKMGSFNKAAKKLYITQPSLTKSIKILEEDLQKELFIRTPKGVKLTVEGNIIYEYCMILFSHIEQMQDDISKMENPMNTSVTISTYDSIAVYFWPKFINYINKVYPELTIRLLTGRSNQMHKKLIDGQCDLAFIIEPKESKHTINEKLAEDKFAYYESTDTKIYKDHQSAPLIIMNQTVELADQKIGTFLNKYREDNHLYEASSLETVKALTSGGVGIGILPTQVARDLVKAKKLKEINPTKFPKLTKTKHNISICYSRYKFGSPLINNLVKELELFTREFY